MSVPKLRQAIGILLAMYAFGGTCAQTPTKSKPASQVQPAVITPPPPGNSFRAVLARAYTETSTKDEGDGVVTFMATIPSVNAPERVAFFAKRDGFRKLTFFTSVDSTFARYSAPVVYAYLSVPDCKAPVFFVSPRTFRSRSSSWLFLNRVAVLADGELLLDQSLADFKPHREIFPGGLEETVDFPLEARQISDLRRLEHAKQVSVRITGDKGYVTLDAKAIEHWRKDVAATIKAHDVVARIAAEKKFDPCA